MWNERALIRQRRRAEVERDIHRAWQVERIRVETQNKKRLPSLRALLMEGRRQTPADHVAILSGVGLKGVPRLNVRVRG